jgi:multidrug efflux system membrane fusion protein
MLKKIGYIGLLACVTTLTWALFIRQDNIQNIEPAAGQESASVMPVTVKTLVPQDVQLWTQFSGRLVAVEQVNIRTRVAGAIDKIYFQPGSIVKKGQPLFLIDPRPYRAEVDRQAAAVASTQAQQILATSEAERANRLIKDNAISKREYDERINSLKVASAHVKSAQAILQQAQLNLNYATITSPIDGKIGRAEVTVGNLIDPAQSLVLTEIVSVKSIYVDFEIDEQTYLNTVRKSANSDNTPVRLLTNSDDSVEYLGKITSFDNKLDTTSGTIRARAEFINHDGALVPGMFANVYLGNPKKASSIFVSDRWVTTDQDKKIVYIVDKKNKVEYRPVKLGNTVDGMRMVTAGLNEGDRVITKGLQHVRPGMVVDPQEEISDVDAKLATEQLSQ